MDKKHFELLLRQTPFGKALLLEIWDDLNTMQRIDLLLHLVEQSKGVPNELLVKALDDPNSVVRMLAVKKSYIDKEEAPELYAKLKNDNSALVKAAMNTDKLLFDENDWTALNHAERLGVIALSNHLGELTFANFITNGLKNSLLSEDEASELVTEFVCNPNLISSTTYEPSDGSDWYYQGKCFEGLWSLTTSTPPRVHSAIAWEYPLKTDGGLGHKTPEEMLDRMSTHTIVALANRQHESLLKRLEEEPDKFEQNIHDAARHGSEDEGFVKKVANSEIEVLRNDLDEFRTEIRESLNILAEHLHTEATRKRGFFG
jgi:hypothetical protein